METSDKQTANQWIMFISLGVGLMELIFTVPWYIWWLVDIYWKLDSWNLFLLIRPQRSNLYTTPMHFFVGFFKARKASVQDSILRDRGIWLWGLRVHVQDVWIEIGMTCDTQHLWPCSWVLHTWMGWRLWRNLETKTGLYSPLSINIVNGILDIVNNIVNDIIDTTVNDNINNNIICL